MEVKNNIINNRNIYSVDNNSSQYGNDALELGSINLISNSNAVKSEVSSDSFDESRDKDQYAQKELDEALKKINNFLEDEKTHAEYSVHKDFGTLMIKIVDDESKEVILEIPPEKILDMVASMCKQVGLLDKKA